MKKLQLSTPTNGVKITMKKLGWMILGGILVVAGYYAIKSVTGGTDTPILVGDGSVVIGSPVPFDTWGKPDDSTLVHPNSSAKIRGIDVLGTQKDACPGNSPCTIRATWSNGITLVVHTDPNGRGATIKSSVTFLKGWEKYPYTWIYPTPSAALSDISVQKGNSSQWNPVCTGPNCRVVIHYK
jgi:hypothetical protein